MSRDRDNGEEQLDLGTDKGWQEEDDLFDDFDTEGEFDDSDRDSDVAPGYDRMFHCVVLVVFDQMQGRDGRWCRHPADQQMDNTMGHGKGWRPHNSLHGVRTEYLGRAAGFYLQPGQTREEVVVLTEVEGTDQQPGEKEKEEPENDPLESLGSDFEDK